ncbi:MAG: response regulator transcription factor [Deltaproteobacteria bacterium]|nr:response regulator transcription factor [Deltaproteobacteria bacterium]
MAILLSSANRSVIKRWNTLLADEYQLEQATSIGELRSRCAEKKFDLFLIHRSLLDMETFSEIRQSAPLSKFFVLSDRPNEEEGLAFLKLGIVGYGNTYISRGRLAEAVRVISNGGVWLGQKVMQRLIGEMYARTKEEAPSVSEQKLAGLTRRERAVAELVAQGQSNLEIAFNLNITERTVKAHLTSIYEKTGTGSRLNLALLVNQGGSA